MKRIDIFHMIAAALAIVAIGVGIYAIGGPSFARQDRLDEKRLMEIKQIAEALLCSAAEKNKGSLPEALVESQISQSCWPLRKSDDLLFDPVTSQPYTYQKVSETDFEICAPFYDAARMWKRSSRTLKKGLYFRSQTGCLRGRL